MTVSSNPYPNGHGLYYDPSGSPSADTQKASVAGSEQQTDGSYVYSIFLFEKNTRGVLVPIKPPMTGVAQSSLFDAPPATPGPGNDL